MLKLLYLCPFLTVYQLKSEFCQPTGDRHTDIDKTLPEKSAFAPRTSGRVLMFVWMIICFCMVGSIFLYGWFFFVWLVFVSMVLLGLFVSLYFFLFLLVWFLFI